MEHRMVDRKRTYMIEELKRKGYRITNQRRILLDVILEHDCSCCKEIHYRAVKRNPAIGLATVYRMMQMLEDAGLVRRQSYYRVDWESCMEERMAG